MTSSTIQFVVVGALVVAWGWMLGRPLVFNLMRRSRRDSVGNFRYQQTLLSPPDDQVPGRRSLLPRPIAEWKAQPLERRRLQVLMGFAIATFTSLLLAIALRGAYVRFLGVMASCFVAYLCVAAYIGSMELRRAERGTAGRGRAEARAARRAGERIASVDRVTSMGPIIGWEVPPVADPGLSPTIGDERTDWDHDELPDADQDSLAYQDSVAYQDLVADQDPVWMDTDEHLEVPPEPVGYHDHDQKQHDQQQQHDHDLERIEAEDREFWDEEPAAGRTLFGDGFGRGIFEDGFFDPIPELQPDRRVDEAEPAAILEPEYSESEYSGWYSAAGADLHHRAGRSASGPEAGQAPTDLHRVTAR